MRHDSFRTCQWLLILAMCTVPAQAVATPQETGKKATSSGKTSAAAADAPKSSAPTPVSKTPASGTPPGTAAQQREEHVIYLPYTDLKKTFEKQDSSVVLPYSQFLQMWDRLAATDQPTPHPPVQAVIARANYVGAVVGDLARFKVTLDIDVLVSDWARLPLEFGAAAVGDISTKANSVLLRGVGNGKYELLAHGQGHHQVILTLVVGVQATPEGRHLTVACPPVGVSTLAMDIPESDLIVQVSPDRSAAVSPTGPQRTHITSTLGATKEFTVAWQPKSGQSDQQAGLANVTDTIIVDVGDGIVHTDATLEYEILRGSLAELAVTLPGDQRVLDVQVPGLRDWHATPGEGVQHITIRLHAPARETLRLQLHSEMPVAAGAMPIGRLRAVGAARESGILAIRSAADVGLEFTTLESVTRVDAADAPEPLRKPRTSFFKYFTPSYKLALVATELQPRIIVMSHITLQLSKTRLTLRAAFHNQISRAGVFSLTYRLPKEFQVDDVRTESMERFALSAANDSQLLTVYFSKKLLGEVPVTVIASQPRERAAEQLTAPLPEPIGVTRERGLVAVVAPESLELKTDESALQAARAATPAELSAEDFKPTVPNGSTLAAAFFFVTRPVQIVQTITERPRRTAVTVGTVVNVREDVVQVATTFRYHIQFAGADTFRLRVPASASDRLQIEGTGIKERRRADQPGADGSYDWTIVLHSEVMGDYSFTASYDQKIAVPDTGTQVELQPIQVLDADRETGEIAVQKDRILSVGAEFSGLEEIDPRELTQPLGTQPYLTYRYYQHPVQLQLHVTKHALQNVVKTVIRRAYVEAVITDDGPITMRARYELKSSERQRLAIMLRDPRILGISVAGRTVAPEKAPATAPATAAADAIDRTYLINVARSTGTDDPFQISIVFETPRPGGPLGMAKPLELPLPRFEKGVKTQLLYVRVWVPKDYRLVSTPPGFTSHIGVGLWDSRRITRATDNPDSWFTTDTSSFDFQVGGTAYLYSSLVAPPTLTVDYWQIPPMTAIASVLVFLFGAALTRSRLDTKVFGLLLIVFVGVLASLFWPAEVFSWVLAARLGIAAVVVVWFAAWILYVRRTGLLSQMAGQIVRTGPRDSTLSSPSADTDPSAPAPNAESSPIMIIEDSMQPPASAQNGTSPFAPEDGGPADAGKPVDDSANGGHDEP